MDLLSAKEFSHVRGMWDINRQMFKMILTVSEPRNTSWSSFKSLSTCAPSLRSFDVNLIPLKFGITRVASVTNDGIFTETVYIFMPIVIYHSFIIAKT